MSIQVARWDVGRGAETGGKAGDGGCDSPGIRVTPRVCGMRLSKVVLRGGFGVQGEVSGRGVGSNIGAEPLS
ncbi:hypothetical protein NYE25_11040 [Paenibacillus sp. FSL E2-8871]|uniref:hypothetical protein n=1 Tax=Paenibacillus sp. FSL E2-8871 TaxID=2975326 RepID=UPI0030FBB299